MSDLPLVTCVLTTKDRRIFARQAMGYILAQNYPRLEMVVIDSGKKRLSDVPPNTWIEWFSRGRTTPVYHCDPGQEITVGESRNVGARIGRGQIIAHFDDDDFYGIGRIASQVETLRLGADVCAADRCYELDLQTRKAYPHNSCVNPRFFSGGTSAYWRATWERVQHRDITMGEDGDFYFDCQNAGLKVAPWAEMAFYCYIRHRSNGSLGEVRKSEIDSTDIVRQMMGKNWAFYADLADLAPTRSHDTPPDPAAAYRNPYKAGMLAAGLSGRIR